MHDAAYAYVGQVLMGMDLQGQSVLEVGSYDVNGSIRPLFDGCGYYLGIDKRSGPGVDNVCDVREFAAMFPVTFDIVVCCEVLEHDADPQGVLEAISKCMAPGSVLILTAADESRTPHSSKGTQDLQGEVYTRISRDNMSKWLEPLYEAVDVVLNGSAHDLYVLAVRK